MKASAKTLEAVKELGGSYEFTYPTYGSRAPKTYKVYRRIGRKLLGEAGTLKGAVDIAAAHRKALLGR